MNPRDRLPVKPACRRPSTSSAGLERPAAAWERDYLPARVTGYEGSWLSRLAGGGSIVWAATPRRPAQAQAEIANGERDGSPVTPDRVETLAGIRFVARGTGALWLSVRHAPVLSEPAIAVRDELTRHGASFLADLEAELGAVGRTGGDALGPLAVAMRCVSSSRPAS